MKMIVTILELVTRSEKWIESAGSYSRLLNRRAFDRAVVENFNGWALRPAIAGALLSHTPNELPSGMSLADTVDKIEGLSEKQRECIENCNEATEVCEWCADECLGNPDMEECARLCRDVADLTSLHARFMARGSGYSSTLAEACAEACEACADECSKHDANHCQVCADVLQECAESCRQMANA